MNSELKDKINNLPLCAGCYIYKNIKGDIIYVGKSKSLRKRVKSYFKSTKIVEDNKDFYNDIGRYKKTKNINKKIERLVNDINDLEYIVTKTESDALILECELIKKYRPYFNVMLKMDTTFSYLAFENINEMPIIKIANKNDILQDLDNNIYIGSFRTEQSIIDTVIQISTVWNIPTCFKKDFTKKTSHCLRFDMHKCVAPCCVNGDENLYKKSIKDIISFFKNNDLSVYNELEKQMNYYSEQLEFEKAIIFKEKIDTLNILLKKVKRLDFPVNTEHLFLFFRAYNEKTFYLYYINKGKTTAKVLLTVENIDKDLLKDFITNCKNKIYENYNIDTKIQYLQEIYADKMFVAINTIEDTEKLTNKLFDEYLEFTK